MIAYRTLRSHLWAFMFFASGLAAGQNSTPAPQSPDAAHVTSTASGKSINLADLVDAVVRQERRLTDFMGTVKPIIETYIQEEGSRPRFQQGITLNGDDYFLRRLSLNGNLLSTVPFAEQETWKRTEEFIQDPPPFNEIAFAQALFPDLNHFDRQNYTFEFVGWENLGEVHCAALDVRPRENLKNRGFVGRIWVEDQNDSIVRFEGAFTKGLARRAYHFNSWRLNIPGIGWIPAYVYTEESGPDDSSSHKLWFRAQTRVWGYDPPPQEDSQALIPSTSEDEITYPPEDTVLKRAQTAGLMAPNGDVNQILETVLNNLLITNNLDLPGLRCRVLLTTPLESFVMGRTIVVSRGLLDVLPDESTLAAVLAHELAHVVLGHAVDPKFLRGFDWPFPEPQIFTALDFHFDRVEEKDASKKALELFSKSPYKDQSANVGLFLQALDARSARFPNLLRGRFSNDFRTSNLIGMQGLSRSPKPRAALLNQVSALPLGSRIVVDPWSDRIEITKAKPVPLLSPAERIPFQVTPFYPRLKRQAAPEKLQSRAAQ